MEQIKEEQGKKIEALKAVSGWVLFGHHVSVNNQQFQNNLGIESQRENTDFSLWDMTFNKFIWSPLRPTELNGNWEHL